MGTSSSQKMSSEGQQSDRQGVGAVDHQEEDVSGLGSLVSNVLASWGGHTVFVVAGFVLPRVIDGRLGPESLGVWDFTWSLVTYFSLVQAGVVSSINRYVARFRAQGDLDGINCAISSVTCVLFVMGLLIAVLAFAMAALLPVLFGKRLGSYMQDAQWLVVLLGLGLVVQVWFSAFGGVLTGYHRWGIHNAIHAGTHLVTVAAMIVVLVCGGGLVGLGAVNLAGELLGRAVRVVVAYRVCPGLSVRVRHASWQTTSSMLGFGGKTFIPQIGELLQNQTINILVLACLDLSVVAIYARPASLIRQTKTFLQKYANILTPTASALQAMGSNRGLADLVIKSSRFTAFVCLPLVVMFVVWGGPILTLWMGADYGEKGGVVLAILAVGNVTTFVQCSMRNVLIGMNMHGRVGIANVVAAGCSIVMAITAMEYLHWGLPGLALAVTVPITVVNGFYVPFFTCRQLGLRLSKLANDVLRLPLLCALPFAAGIILARFLLDNGQVMWSIACGVIASLCLVFLYAKYALPDSLRASLLNRVSRREKKAPAH